jgi:F-type H+-transporting ATPase subunit beta
MSVVGKIISVSDLNVKILLSDSNIRIKDILFYKDEQNVKHRFEIVEMNSNIALAIPFESVNGIKKGIDLSLEERRITN